MDNHCDTGIFLAERAHNRVLFLPDFGDPACVVMDHGLNDPYGLTMIPDGRLIIADKMHHRLLIVDDYIRLVKTHDRLNQRKSPFSHKREYPWCPTSVWVEPAGTWFVSYSEDHAIYRIHADGSLELVVGIHAGQHIRYSGCREHLPPAEILQVALQQPTSVVQKADGSLVFVEHRFQIIRQYHPSERSTCLFPVRNQEAWEHHRIQGCDLPDKILVTNYYPTYPTSLTVTPEDTLIIADGVQRCIWKLQNDYPCCIYRSQGEGRGGPAGLCWGPEDVVWVFDYADASVVGLQRSGSGRWQRCNRLVSTTSVERRASEGAGIACGKVPTHVKKRLNEQTSALRT
jgi:hypothetical protein